MPDRPPPAPRLDGKPDLRPWPPLQHPHTAGDPEKAFQPGFTMLDALVVILFGFVVQVVVGVVAVVLGVQLAGAGRALVAVTIVAQTTTLVATLGWLKLRGVALWKTLGPIRPAPRHVAQGVGLGLVGVLLVLLVSLVTSSLLPEAPQPDQVLLGVLGQDWLATFGVIVVACVLAPLQEELTYRSLLFQSTRARIGLPGGLVLSSLVFAGAHLEVWNSPPALFGLLALALWFAAVFHQTGSLVVPVVGHATFNGVMLGLSQAVPQDMPGV